jgi:CspA family cold shock protein
MTGGFMLKRITKFVLERSKTVQKPQQQVVENDDTTGPTSVSESLTHAAEPQLDEPSSQPVWAKVKWYNPDKRYGFVVLSDGSGDAFLHASALAGIGISTLQPGETLALRVSAGERGLLVTEVISVDSSTATPSRPSRTRIRSSSDRQPLEASVQEMGTVKWYSASRGFGFIARDGGRREGRFPACLSTGARRHH